MFKQHLYLAEGNLVKRSNGLREILKEIGQNKNKGAAYFFKLINIKKEYIYIYKMRSSNIRIVLIEAKKKERGWSRSKFC